MRIRDDLRPLKQRTAVLVAAIGVAIAVLEARLFQLQVVDGHHWQARAENNRLRQIPEVPLRGRIFDRTGTLLADNRPTFELLLFPGETADLPRTIRFVAATGVASEELLAERLAEQPSLPDAPVRLADDLTWRQVAHIRAHRLEHPELTVVSSFRRSYPHGSLCAHAVGYLRRPRSDEATSGGGPHLVGAVGVEDRYDARLAGTTGQRRIAVDATGRQLGLLELVPSVPGKDLTITLDLRLQRVAAEALGEEAGAVVGIEPGTGAVRVLYAAPSFDPNLFAGQLSSSAWAEIRDDPQHPLQNRCLQGLYPPGSTIKPFLLLAALQENVISPRWSVVCNGRLTLFGHTFHCWRRSGHGRVTPRESLEVSCDVFYYRLGQRLGIDRIAEWMRRFGFGSRSGLGLKFEAEGLVGTPEWSQRVRQQPWYAGSTVIMSIGQGPFLVTPLQVAQAFATLVNEGRRVTPKLLETTAEAAEQLSFDADALNTVRAGLEQVVHGRHGTAPALRAVNGAGKTGTAQVVRLRDDVEMEELDKSLQHHAWFVGFAPRDDPRLVVAALVEHGGSGGSVAAPIAAEVLAAAVTPESSR
jgi:penicillin-binding protein 2